MTEPGAVDLINLEDADGSRCVVRVTGRFQPGVLTGHDILRADVLTSTEFVDARLELFLSQEDLTAWQHDLTRLVPGTGVDIGGDRGLSLAFHMHEDRSLSVTVDDPDRLTTTLWLQPPQTWIQEHHQRLERVRKAWPSEVVETAPMAYAWSPSRNR
ncbi:DUF5959 family protein [Streptomyces sp. NPDC059575]|uniref:DUF5959 family protein n=1 Tax=Streptomyces sp. NPDC059575 TaxID=3346872 RepID=UPI00367E6A05